MSILLLADAIKHSTKTQLEAVFDAVRVDVYPAKRSKYIISVDVFVTHRGKQYGCTRDFPYEITYDSGFYDDYLREGLSRRICSELGTMLMKEALDGKV